MLNEFDTADLLSTRRNDTPEEDERTVSDFMVDQIEFANVILLNKCDKVTQTRLKELHKLIKTLNRGAVVYETKFGKLEVSRIINTKPFDLAKAQVSVGWLQDLHDLIPREARSPCPDFNLHANLHRSTDAWSSRPAQRQRNTMCATLCTSAIVLSTPRG
jgi:G3E family GTPase